MVKCPFCNGEFQAQPLKAWRFRFYDVEMLECPKCRNAFNHYHGVSPADRGSEFVIRIRPSLEFHVVGSELTYYNFTVNHRWCYKVYEDEKLGFVVCRTRRAPS